VIPGGIGVPPPLAQITFLISLLSALTAFFDSATVAQACPAEVPQTRVLVERFLTRPAYQESRRESGLTGTMPSSIRLSRNGTDDAVCTRLNTAVGSSTGQWDRGGGRTIRREAGTLSRCSPSLPRKRTG